jgi:hypothetical protein
MFARAPRFLLCTSTALLVTACSTTSTGPSTSPVLSAQTTSEVSSRTIEDALDSAPVVTGQGRMAIAPSRVRPDASKAPAFLISFVGAGEAQSGVPCIDCVSGAQTGDNVGLSGPGNYVPSAATWQYTLAYTNIKFKGKCTLAWAITNGADVVDKFSVSLKLTQTGGFVLYGLNRVRPKYSGPAELTGRVTCGSAPAQTAQAPMLFQ